MKKAIPTILFYCFVLPFLFSQIDPSGKEMVPDYPCACEGTYVQIDLYYFGKDNVSFKAYRDPQLTDLIWEIREPINSGQKVVIDTRRLTKKRLDSKTYLVVINSSGKSRVVDIRTSCPQPSYPEAMHEQEILGKTFGDFIVFSHTDQNGKQCRLDDIDLDWQVGGNVVDEVVPDSTNAIGTKNYEDLVFITNDLTRLTITKDGEVRIGNKLLVEGNLEVRGDSVLIHHNLYARDTSYLKYVQVDSSVVLNAFGGDTQIEGATTIGGDEKNKAWLRGELLVDGVAQFDADVFMKNDLDVEKKITAQTVEISQDLKVGQTTMTKSLLVKDNLEDGAYLATFENTNNKKGDGIKIKLGKTAARNYSGVETINNDLTDYINNENMGSLKTLFDNTPDNDEDAINALILKGTTPPNKYQDLLNATTCKLTSIVAANIVGMINDGLKLPPIQTFPGFSFSKTIVKKTIGFSIPPIYVGPIKLGGIPVPGLGVNNLEEGCRNILNVQTDLFKSLKLSDNPGNWLDSENAFITFVDQTDKFNLGSIRAQSINNWTDDYFDDVFFYEMVSAYAGIDLTEAVVELKVTSKSIAKDYLSIGVEYSSGNGDYAEWLERLNPKEAIGSGDIVAVKGGKITKDLSNAEQVMAVSHHPIVLGNIPEEGKAHLGNNIAFMGQVPVKIMGPVSTGDYIVGKGDIQGYGVAVSPEHMTLEDFQLAVGRAWESDLSKGPKMVNTVIGVHNGDYLNILKRYDEKIKASEARLEAVEAKVDRLSDYLLQEKVSN